MYKRPGTVGLLALLFLLVPASSFALIRDSEDGTVTDPREYPIIFVHGAAGSELDRGGTNLWPGSIGGIVNDSSAAMMALNSDGKTDCCGKVTATKVMRYGAGYDLGFLNAQFAPVYQGFYDYMEAQGFGYEKSEDGKVFYDFVYDWRKDNRTWTADLDRKVNQARSETHSDKVILIGHSMGGIQIRLYMNDPANAKKVAGVVFLATPHHGAPQVLWAYTYGYNFGNSKVGNTRMWEVMKNWPAGYQLLPDYPSIQDSETGKFWTMEDLFAGKFYSEQEYQHTLDSATGREATYHPKAGLPNLGFAKDALLFHQSVLGDSVKKYPDVKYFMVAGTGQMTTQYFEGSLVPRPGFELPVLQLKPVRSANGDGTVPSAGAKIEGVDEFVTVVGEHGAIPSTPAAQVLVTKYRKLLNDEDFRKNLHERAARFADSKLPEAARMRNAGVSVGESSSEGNIAVALFRAFFFGVPNEEKIKARDELRRDAGKVFENMNINIEITGSGDHETDHVYLVIKNFKVTAHGSGTISTAKQTVHIPSYEVFDQIVGGQVDLWEGYKSGVFTVTGNGIINNLKMRFFSWIAKFAGK